MVSNRFFTLQGQFLSMHVTPSAKWVREWLGGTGVKSLFIQHGSPWGNGYNENFNGKLREELLNYEIFYNLKEAQV